MKTKRIKNSVVIYHEIHYETREGFREFFESQEFENFAANLEAVIVLGGDGMMLSTINEFYKDEKPFLGINFGTKGFLMHPVDVIKNELKTLTRNDFDTISYPLIRATIEMDNLKNMSNALMGYPWEDQPASKQISVAAFNEVQLKSATGRSVELEIKIPGKETFSWIGDGALVCTPVGSTAYSAAAGGEIYDHGNKDFQITPLLTFEPKNAQPVIFDQDETIDISYLPARRSRIAVYADGEPILKTIDQVDISFRKSKRPVNLLIKKSFQDEWKDRVQIEREAWKS